MKYCPICRSEFYDKVKVCPDHHVKLVDSLKHINMKIMCIGFYYINL